MFKTAVDKFLAFIFVLFMGGCIVFGYLFLATHKENVLQKRQLEEQATKISAMIEEAKLKKESDKIDVEAVGEIPAKVEKVYVEKIVVDKKVAAKLDEINAKYKDMADTEENRRKRFQDISATRIDGLWDVYCNAVPGTDVCPPNKAKKE